MELSQRLQAVANLLSEGLVVADVGTDHGYIPIYLIETDKCPKAFAMDINKGPLIRAEEHVKEHGLQEQIILRQSDGVKALQVGECESVNVAGMGGALAIKIMEEGRHVFKSLQEFVLQPQSELEKVRRYLHEHEYRIIAEDMVLEDGKYYPMMKVINGTVEVYSPVEFRYGKKLLEMKHPILKMFLQKEVQAKMQIKENLNCEQGEHIEKRISEIETELMYIKEALRVYDSEEVHAL